MGATPRRPFPRAPAMGARFGKAAARAKEKMMEGLYVASMVPFDENGKINDEVAREMIEANIAEGAAGFFVAGSSGECFLLSPEEHLHLFEVFAEYKDTYCSFFRAIGRQIRAQS